MTRRMQHRYSLFMKLLNVACSYADNYLERETVWQAAKAMFEVGSVEGSTKEG